MAENRCNHGSRGGQGRSGKDVSESSLAVAVCVLVLGILVGLAVIGVIY